MSNKPLLENWVIVVDNSENKIHYEKKDVVEALRKFKNNYYNYGRIYQLRDSELDIFDKLFNECFGVVKNE